MTEKRKSGTKRNNAKRTAARSQTKRKTATKAVTKSAAKSVADRRLRREIEALLIFACSILLLISNFGFGGGLGRRFSSVFFGLFGFLAYLFPFLLFGGYVYIIMKMRDRAAKKRFFGACGFFLFLCSFLQLIMIGYEKNTKWLSLYKDSAVDKNGGGLFGGFFVQIFGRAFGTVGAYVLVLLMLVIFAIIMTQEPLLKIVRDRSTRAYLSAKKLQQERRERQALLREEALREEQLREEQLAEDPLSQGQLQQGGMSKEQVGTARNAHSKNSSDPFVDFSEMKLDWNMPSVPFATEISETEEIEATSSASDLPLQAETDFSNTAAAEARNAKLETEIPNSKTKNPKSEQTQAQNVQKAAQSPSAMHETISSEKKNTLEMEMIPATENAPEKKYVFPPISLLHASGQNGNAISQSSLQNTAMKLQKTLQDFGVAVRIMNVSCGPTVTRYELQPEQGVKVSRIINLQDDIKLNLAATDIRIEAPIPGKSAVGIEVPNEKNTPVMFRDLLESKAYQQSKAKLTFAVGKDIGGMPVVTDIAKMPHVLIAGATGSGKSVCINTLIMSILYKSTPDEVKFIMIDPKMVELSVYNGIPHLFIPVVTDPKKAAGALDWAVAEMTDRYNKFAEKGVRNLQGYNEKLAKEEPETPKMSRLVIIVDELADLMMVAQHEVETSIVRLSQLARAAGIHLVIATQRPSVNVITGLIKANMPSRIALAVTSGVDSRTILDMNGAEKLLGRGDMLFFPQNLQKPERVQGAFISDEEIADVVAFLSSHSEQEEVHEEVIKHIESAGSGGVQTADAGEDRDVYFIDAAKLIIDKEKASIGMLQRAFKIGFNRAARIMDQLSEAGVVGPEEGTKPRKILMSPEQFEQYLEGQT